MTNNVVYGHFDSAGSLHKQILSYCLGKGGKINEARLIRLYAGAIAECLLEHDDWKGELDNYFEITKSIENGVDGAQWHERDNATPCFLMDKDIELGRSTIRPYLDENPQTSYLMLRNIRATYLSTFEIKSDFLQELYDITMMALVGEQLIYLACDQIIDICIGGVAWTLGDCVQAMGALSGRYHAKAVEVSASCNKSPDHGKFYNFDYVVNTMMGEALRLGMPDHAGLYKMMAANDMQTYIPHGKSDDIELIVRPLFQVYKIFDADLKSMLMVKATGRMMAVASAGDDPDMDACVVTPLVLSTMQGSYNSFLNV
jgi:hypothetical protein